VTTDHIGDRQQRPPDVGLPCAECVRGNVPCPPTGDPALDDQGIREGLQDELMLSRPNHPSEIGRAERRGYLYLRDDGSYLGVPANDPTATQCGFTFPDNVLPAPPVIEGAIFLGDYHTHPSYDGEELTDCGGLPSGQKRRADRSTEAGGGSEEDWDFANRRGKPLYTVDLDGNVYRLAPLTPWDERGNNPNHWNFVSSTNACLESPS
jgi:hypothetical protein